MKLTQPRKNGGEDIGGELALWWQGDMQPATTMNFLRFSLAQVTGLSLTLPHRVANTSATNSSLVLAVNTTLPDQVYTLKTDDMITVVIFTFWYFGAS